MRPRRHCGTGGKSDGAVVGDYKVAIADVDAEAYNTPLPGAPLKAPKHRQPNHSGGR